MARRTAEIQNGG